MRIFLFITLLCQASLLHAGPTSKTPWQVVSNGEDDGIKVWKRVQKGSKLLEFRGQGVVDAGIAEVLTLLTDPDRVLDWVEGSVKAELLDMNYNLDDKALYSDSKIKDLYHIQYLEHFVPFPFENRDVVLEGRVSYYLDPDQKEGGAKIVSRSISRPSLPPKDGITRMPLLENVTNIKMVDETHSLVDFRVKADPGGLIPEWLINLSTSRIPHITISNIREMIKKGQYEPKRLKLVKYHFKRLRGQL